MRVNLIEIAYLGAAICFILALKGLSSPKTARRGNLIGIGGMALSVLASFYLPEFNHSTLLIIIISLGALVGTYIARKIPMTAIPQLIAGFHSFVGLAAVLIGFAALLAPENFAISISGYIRSGALLEIGLGAVIGAITFSGSLIAFGKLQGMSWGVSWFGFAKLDNLLSQTEQIHNLKHIGQKYGCLILSIALLLLTICFVLSGSVLLFTLLIILAISVGILLIMPIGAADMPVIVSMLNSYSGWAAAGIGFTCNNNLLVITGALVGASGAILSYVMCHAMNRSLFKVIFGAFVGKTHLITTTEEEQGTAKVSSPEDAAFMLQQAESVIIVPGYGMAVAQSQHAIREMVDILHLQGIKVRFAIHPVAGRMPGHMNVLLAEANIDYENVLELEDINNDFATTDVVLVIGANDVTNPAAKDPESPIYGMPVLNVGEAKTVFFIKRSMASGYAGIANKLFFQDNTLMLFGDAKKVIEDIMKFLK